MITEIITSLTKDEVFSFFLTLLSSATVSAALAAGLVWLSKNWISQRLKSSIEHEYGQKLETHKAQIKAEGDIQLERLKSELQIAAAERHLRFSRLLDKQALLIEELYTKLRALDYGVRQVRYNLNRTPLNKEWLEAASSKLTKAYTEAREHFEQHQIFFSPDLCQLLKKVIDLSSDISDEYYVTLIDKKGADLEEARKDACKALDDKSESINEGITQIDREFRLLVGALQRN